MAGIGHGTAYFNLHSAVFPGGELRGNLFEQSIFGDGFEWATSGRALAAQLHGDPVTTPYQTRSSGTLKRS